MHTHQSQGMKMLGTGLFRCPKQLRYHTMRLKGLGSLIITASIPCHMKIMHNDLRLLNDL